MKGLGVVPTASVSSLPTYVSAPITVAPTTAPAGGGFDWGNAFNFANNVIGTAGNVIDTVQSIKQPAPAQVAPYSYAQTQAAPAPFSETKVTIPWLKIGIGAVGLGVVGFVAYKIFKPKKKAA